MKHSLKILFSVLAYMIGSIGHLQDHLNLLLQMIFEMQRLVMNYSQHVVY